ncbi:MAG: carotenoid biosynthesis protein [Candidatus Magasanikbacteria bacterium]
MQKFNKENSFWYIFFLGFLVLIATSIGQMFSLPFFNNLIFSIIIPIIIPMGLMGYHAFFTLNIRRGLFLIVFAGLVGWFFEIIGLKYRTFFGGQYIYNTTIPLILDVPYAVVIFWSFFIYFGYTFTTSFLYWSHKDKPNKDNHKLFLLFVLILMDGLTVTAIDLFMDPIQAKAGTWTWLQGGAYFGVPIGNFVGWFTVTVIVTSIFRIFEYFFPQKSTGANKKFFLIPVIGYIILAFYYTANAIYFELYGLIVVGLFLMLSMVTANLFYYFNSSKPS